MINDNDILRVTDDCVTIVLPGKPETKKTSNQIAFNRKTGRRFILPSKAYLAWEKKCCWLLTLLWRHAPIDYPMHVKARFYRDLRPDLDNLKHGVADVLQKAGVIKNDRLIKSWDGSRLIKSKETRVEVSIYRYVEEIE